MRYLLLSVLVVCMIGVMIPNVLGDHGDIWSDQNEDEEHAWIDKLPSGVIFPAPNFGDAVRCDSYNVVKDWMDLDTGCIYEIFYYYEDIDFPQQHYGWSYGIFDVDDRKIVRGDGKDLLVFQVMVENKSDSPAKLYHKHGNQGFKMYDGKDREYTTITSKMLVGLGGSPTEDPAFSWNEVCPFYNVNLEIQSGIEEKVKLCFEIPKNSNHFKVVYDSVGKHDELFHGMVLLFDRDAIKHQTQQQVTEPTEPTSTSIEPIYLLIAAVAIGGGAVGALFALKRGSGTPNPAKEELEEYEEKYLAEPKRKPKPTKQKHVEKEETSSSCSNCGKPLKPTAKFCGGCGTPVS